MAQDISSSRESLISLKSIYRTALSSHNLGAGDGSPPPYQVIALLTFRSLQDCQKAAEAHIQEILGDIPNFTSVQPVVQISEDLI